MKTNIPHSRCSRPAGPGKIANHPFGVSTFWLLLFAAMAWTPLLRGQIIGLQDVFNYHVTNIQGHAPTTGTGTWQTSYGAGTTGSSNISVTGSTATIMTNSGTAGSGNAVASLTFTPMANTTYTITATYNFRLTGTNVNCWTACGFSNSSTGGGTQGPWEEICPQTTSTTANGSGNCSIGASNIGSFALTGSAYWAPMTATINWNTNTGVANYYVNNVLQCTGTTALPSGPFYAFFQGFATGSSVSVSNITVGAQQISFAGIEMEDSFDYISSNINGATPTLVAGSGWSAPWTSISSSGTISTNGTQAVINMNGGVPGSGNAVGSFPFEAAPNTFYTMRAAIQFNGPIGVGAGGWAGVGFGNGTGGGGPGPWMNIRPQATSGADSSAVFHTGTSSPSVTVPAADYLAPITATVTWNSNTGVANYYINDLLQCTGTTAPPSGKNYAFFQAFTSGNYVYMDTVSMTAQQLPLPEIWMGPQDWDHAANQWATIISSTCTWPTARTYTNVLSVFWNWFFSGTPAQQLAQNQQLFNYLRANNMKLNVIDYPLIETSDTTCTHLMGFEYPSNQAKTIAAIQAAGGWIDYLSLDTVLLDSLTLTGSCAMPMTEAASEAASTVATYTAAFPNLKLVEYDGIGGGVPDADAAAWFPIFNQALTSAGCNPLYGICDDIGWRLCTPDTTLVEAAQICASNNVQYGIFCDDGPNNPYTNENPVTERLGEIIDFQIFSHSSVPVPARTQYSDWTPFITYTCPEASGTTLTAFMDMSMTSPYALQEPPVGLYDVWHKGPISKDIYTTSESQFEALISDTTNYTSNPPCGGVMLNYQRFAGFTLDPLYLYCNSALSGTGYAISTSANDSGLNGNGYVLSGTLGYCLPLTTGSSLGGVALYEFYNSSLNTYKYTILNTTPNGFVPTGVKGYVLPSFFPIVPQN